MDIQVFAKALVPILVAVVMLALPTLGLDPHMSVQDAVTNLVTLAITAGLVYLVPNKPQGGK